MNRTTVVNKRDVGERYDVYIGRPSKWGNPFSHYISRPQAGSSSRGVTLVASRKEAIEAYKAYLKTRPDLLRAIKKELGGRILACWCSPLPCHGDILAAIANGELEL